ncbi:ImmA/IrrE family metallo-endopeptidase [Nitratireductor sp. StC3]|uniref:ImmA/IrrE family metallo-endopeptidase n=1 Tax=Nitratireductor sp. StC3 TaxID=2126741 RepID=UPI000D0D1BD3|nr:ImmA/IrrE family metallo-endopeptidase [Nitratireductor sp. StC3]PSM19321.1 ImmA/IrrE family metallo-endopeptidase [Nitratireductor sp. StC3]
MNSTSKGDKLEDAFYRYLVEQKDRGDLVFGVYAAKNCKIYKRKSYYCRQRHSDVEFDVVLEIYRTGSDTPHLYVIFECKNHKANVSEMHINDFSSKIGRIFPYASKGVIVVTSRLQSGAEMVARNGAMGIVKFDEHGLEIVADRKSKFLENAFLSAQMFWNENIKKSLKFSGFYEGKYYSNIGDMVTSLDPEVTNDLRFDQECVDHAVPFLSLTQIKLTAEKLLNSTGYTSGAVDLIKICQILSIDLHFSDRKVVDIDGTSILGSAIFGQKMIVINSHSLQTRERFTLAHEIGHFALDHERYLLSESIVERDLFVTKDKSKDFNYDRLEYQANIFAAELILPDVHFLQKVIQFRRDLGIKDRGHGYIFVDDQPYNFFIYNEMLSRLSNYFQVSRQAIEVKLRNSKMLTDQRKRNRAFPIFDALNDMVSNRKN